MEKLRIYLNTLSPDQQKLFAILCNTTIGYLRKAISEGQLLNPKTCVRIESNTLHIVSRKDLRPDDFASIWPEFKQPE